jgi:hypothetical protein
MEKKILFLFHSVANFLLCYIMKIEKFASHNKNWLWLKVSNCMVEEKPSRKFVHTILAKYFIYIYKCIHILPQLAFFRSFKRLPKTEGKKREEFFFVTLLAVSVVKVWK